MRFCLTVVLCLLATNAVGQEYDIYNLQTQQFKNDGSSSGTPESGIILFDDLESLPFLEPGEPSAAGVFWNAVGGVETVKGNTLICHLNMFGNDQFQSVIAADWNATVQPSADVGFALSIEFALSDLNTQFFYTLNDANLGIIFNRIGDVDSDGDWDVLETDGLGGSVFVDTGNAIPLEGTIRIEIVDMAMDILVNEKTIYSGGIIGSNGDIGITPGENVTSLDIVSGNNVGGLGSELCIDNLLIERLDVCLAGDVNRDGVVNLLDVAPFVEVLQSGIPSCEADINKDGIVDLLDVQELIDLIVG